MGPRTSRKTTRLRAIAGAALATCALATAATPALADPAADFAPGSLPTVGAQNVAAAYWNADPCHGQITLVWAALDPSINATSSWVNPVAAYGAPDQNTDCTITFNSAIDWDWTRFCSVLVHEYGHLNGLPHSTDPADVMYPIYQGPVAQCTALAATDGPVDPARAPGPPAATAAAHPVSRLRAAARRPLKLGRVVVEPQTPHRHALRRRHAGHRRAARGPHRHVRRWGPEPRAVSRRGRTG